MTASPSQIAITRAVREDWGRILAALVKTFGDFQLAEDCLQDAALAAITAWSKGVPDAPDAWLITTAKRKALDRIRRDQTLARKTTEIAFFLEHQQADPAPERGDMHIPDKRLELLFTCCHPALDPKTQTALTLRTLGGLTAEEIAHAFLDKTATMAQRLSRARTKIRVARIPYQVPDPADLPARQATVLQVIYLIFNEGYAASHGDTLQRHDLMNEAIRLGRIMADLCPTEAEVSGLLALMLLHGARKAGRTDSAGAMIALEHQDRALWDHAQIAQADGILQNALGEGQIGAYQLQAAIAALHAQSPSWDQTDWPQIAALYGVLGQVTPTAVVKLNQAVAISYARGAEDGLVLLDQIADDLARYSYYHAARADLLARAGQVKAAHDCFQNAINLTENAVDVAFLQAKQARLRPQ